MRRIDHAEETVGKRVLNIIRNPDDQKVVIEFDDDSFYQVDVVLYNIGKSSLSQVALFEDLHNMLQVRYD